MDDLVERLDAEIKRQRETRGTYLDYGTPDPLLVEARARIQALETSLAEAIRERTEARAEAANLRADLRQAEGRVIADVVAWLRTKAVKAWGKDTADTYLNEFAATALETGEWKK